MLMQDIVPSGLGSEVGDPFEDYAWVLEGIVHSPDGWTSHVTPDSLAFLVDKCRNAGDSVPTYPSEVIALASAGLDLYSGSSNTKLRRVRDLFEDAKHRVEPSETDFYYFRKAVSELAPSKTVLCEKPGYSEAILKEAADVEIVSNADRRDLGDEDRSLRRQILDRLSVLTSTRTAYTQFRSLLVTFPRTMLALMDA